MLYSLKLPVAMILGGLSADINTQACLTIAQLILFDSKNSQLIMHQIYRITGTHQVENLSFMFRFETSFSDIE